MSPQPLGLRLIGQYDDATMADGLGDGDQFFSDIERDLSTGSSQTPDASTPSKPSTAHSGMESEWYSDPTSPDLIRYWRGADAAWYPDPTYPGLTRYWDGSRWTNQV